VTPGVFLQACPEPSQGFPENTGIEAETFAQILEGKDARLLGCVEPKLEFIQFLAFAKIPSLSKLEIALNAVLENREHQSFFALQNTAAIDTVVKLDRKQA
jgi:hypothetical protein